MTRVKRTSDTLIAFDLQNVCQEWGPFSIFRSFVRTEFMASKMHYVKIICLSIELQFQVTRDRDNAPRHVVSEVSLCTSVQDGPKMNLKSHFACLWHDT